MLEIILFGPILRNFGLKTLAVGTAPSELDTVCGTAPCLHGRCGPLNFSQWRKIRGPQASSGAPMGPRARVLSPKTLQKVK